MLQKCYKCYKVVTISRFTARKCRIPSSRGRVGAQVYRSSGCIYAQASWKLEAGDKLERGWKHVDYWSWNHGLRAAEYGVRADAIELCDYGDWGAHRLGMQRRGIQGRKQTQRMAQSIPNI